MAIPVSSWTMLHLCHCERSEAISKVRLLSTVEIASAQTARLTMTPGVRFNIVEVDRGMLCH